MSLLDQLRRGKLVPVNHPYRTTRKRARSLMNLMIEHKSEFPTKLRPAIATAALKCRPGIFVSEVYIAATYFFFGQNYHEIGHDHFDRDHLGWHGLDHTIDTEDEAELVIRLFPWILQEELLGMPCPIFSVASNSRAISFVPLFVRLGNELGVFKKGSNGLTWRGGFGSALEQLFVHTLNSPNESEPAAKDFDQESLAMFIRLREMGFVSETNEHRLVWRLFSAAKHREFEFIHSRLRLLVGWNPIILVDWNPIILMGSQQPANLLSKFLHLLQEQEIHEPYVLSMFEAIVELGMSYHPMELGFVFHKINVSVEKGSADLNCCDTNFGLACHMFGKEAVMRTLKEQLSKAIGTKFCKESNALSTASNPLQVLLLAASTNYNISLEGVYTLIRRDPIQMLPCNS